jgi:hypothetical protein
LVWMLVRAQHTLEDNVVILVFMPIGKYQYPIYIVCPKGRDLTMLELIQVNYDDCINNLIINK